MTRPNPSLLPATLIVVAVLLGACASAGEPPTATPVSPPLTPGPTAPANDGGGAGSGPGAPGNGGGVVGPGSPGPVGPVGGQPQLVVPRPGQRNVHPVGIAELAAEVGGRHVVLNARWWSGVEPCAVLDSVNVSRDGSTFTVTVNEGSGAGDVACIDIAVWKATVIDLGELAPGTYTVRPGLGDAAPITVVVP